MHPENTPICRIDPPATPLAESIARADASAPPPPRRRRLSRLEALLLVPFLVNSPNSLADAQEGEG